MNILLISNEKNIVKRNKSNSKGCVFIYDNLRLEKKNLDEKHSISD